MTGGIIKLAAMALVGMMMCGCHSRVSADVEDRRDSTLTVGTGNADLETKVIHYDNHGCADYFSYDKDSHSCVFSLTFEDIPNKVTCSHLAKDYEGYQSMTCTYKAKPYIEYSKKGPK